MGFDSSNIICFCMVFILRDSVPVTRFISTVETKETV